MLMGYKFSFVTYNIEFNIESINLFNDPED